MALSITAALIGSDTPRKVQVVVGGLTLGDSYTVMGEWAGGSWPVRGGQGTATTTQVVLVDNAGPVNVPATYQVTTGAGSVVSAAVTVPWTVGADGGSYLLQSLRGDLVVSFRWMDNGAPLEPGMRSSLYEIPGRRSPVVVYDVASAESGSVVADTEGADTEAMRALLRAGGVALLRTDGAVRDLPAADFIAITRAPSELTGAGDTRRWSLDYRVIADPQPDEVIPTSTWDDFDTAYSGLTWDSFDTEWAGQTWDLFDRTDWTAH